ncbi:cyclopropane-fatty-acyl-phospholipid synthase family protein [Phyllobacterium sp. 21LDTY02-6]|jgi:cyclopropane-fatty-acyl-phospholipid synthase|uniref:SAM-dependent methyltransferase n=1 Tax=unclassified Phyllobacterium TaxID=2638441 RepID=UPI0020208A50|nr:MULTISPECIES: cyclopropane-fatty-acyl-phospholipid synthase family protein [unclassified Phyllobacterium]MCO4319761.1 cyclopropane-fatty-acyl-phospholipid synthase family protein [Phyllobacterium sp. 21LDTY02-6]MCX8280502.1 cyclopropane-fatty-acyl-phospholipid synthase [Phyllobacterium sp. 0TCS1.6C]MCX8295049.1 cyclopropane-fatty-acyl-phospholipid synthase [Phyllobacterium sp. 0TCS1.6A]
MNSILRAALRRMIHTGNLTVTDASGKKNQFGDGSGQLVHFRLNSAVAERKIAFDPSLQFAEAYMNGDLDVLEGDIYDVLKIVFENTGATVAREPWMVALEGIRRATRRLHQMNNLTRSSSNVQRHYDLSEELYRLFLDTDMQYSCAYFERPDATLEEAQLAKKRHIAAKLLVHKDHKTLDIGCGWGGLGLYLARHLEANVTGVTLSQEQHAIANKRAFEEGLSASAQFHLRDYRTIEDSFDRIVSVGMFEHVGVGHFAEYFQHTARLLKKDGVFVLHAIGRSDGPSYTNAFIQKYIFPGGYIPALSEVIPHIEKAGLVVTDIEILRLHYADTLRIWRERFMANRDKAKAIYDERFCRMWEFYLAASESAFRWQNLMVFQIQLAHRQEAVPLTRNYIEHEEKRLKRLECERSSANSQTRQKESIAGR